MADAAPTLASEALRAGRIAIGRSFRFHRRRGPLCGRGYCGACEVETPAGRVLACEAPAGPARRLRRHDPLRPLGLVAERWPPWFYERRFLRPLAARRLYLEALRRLSASGRLGPAATAGPAGPLVEEEVEVAVVGEAGNIGGLVLGVYEGRVLAVLRPGGLAAVRFERLVLATGSYERLPPIPGNDLPGVVGLHAFEAYTAAGALRAGKRIAVWGPAERRGRATGHMGDLGLELVWEGDHAPAALLGRGRLSALRVAEGRIPCDLFVVAAAQPALELALQAGARAALSREGLPILAVEEAPPWLTLEGSAAATASGVAAVSAADEAFACLCEDVRLGDVRRAIAEGFAHPELVKRRTGALTGFCQGKLCAPLVLALLREAGADATPTTARPLARPVRLADLAAGG